MLGSARGTGPPNYGTDHIADSDFARMAGMADLPRDVLTFLKRAQTEWNGHKRDCLVMSLCSNSTFIRHSENPFAPSLGHYSDRINQVSGSLRAEAYRKSSPVCVGSISVCVCFKNVRTSRGRSEATRQDRTCPVAPRDRPPSHHPWSESMHPHHTRRKAARSRARVAHRPSATT